VLRDGGTTAQATTAGAEALGAAVAAELQSEATTDGGTFHPLEAAASVVRLVTLQRPPESDHEAQIVASLGSRRWQTVGVAIVAATDDESPGSAQSYRVGRDASWIVVSVITPEIVTGGIVDARRYPRLATWTEGQDDTFLEGCVERHASGRAARRH